MKSIINIELLHHLQDFLPSNTWRPSFKISQPDVVLPVSSNAFKLVPNKPGLYPHYLYRNNLSYGFGVPA